MAKKRNTHASKELQAGRAERRAEVTAEVRRLADIANKRLRALEKHKLTEASNAYRYVEKRDFDKDSAYSRDKYGRMKFDTTLRSKSAQQLQHELIELKRFLYESKTSTVTGARERYEKAYNTYINNPKLFPKDAEGNYTKNVPPSREEFTRILNMEGVKKYIETFGSSQIVRLIEEAKTIPQDELEQAMDKLKGDEALETWFKDLRGDQPPEAWTHSQAPRDEESDEFVDLTQFTDEGFEFI